MVKNDYLLTMEPHKCKCKIIDIVSLLPPHPTHPAHSTPETVDLKLCSVDENGQVKNLLYQTHFTYFLDQKSQMTDLMIQSAYDGLHSLQLQCMLSPPPSSPEALREYDTFLRDCLSASQLPEGWNMVGSGKEGRIINTVAGEYSLLDSSDMPYCGWDTVCNIQSCSNGVQIGWQFL